jgi:hypothetical protein
MKPDRELFRMLQEEMIQESELDTLLESAPALVKGAVLFWVAKIRNADSQIRQTNDVAKKIDLMSQQIKWSAYMTALAIAFDADDKSLQMRLKGMK